MALLTLGTNATDSLSALLFKQGVGGNGGMSAVNFALLNNGIKDDLGNAHSIVPGAFSPGGILTIPNRGTIKALPGDYVAIDSTGWPILISAYAIANGPWTHS